MNLNELNDLYRTLSKITDKEKYQEKLQTILKGIADNLIDLGNPKVVIAAQTADLKTVYFGTFRNVSFIRNQIMINDAIRSIGMMDVNSGIWYIHGESYQTVSVEPYRPEASYHQDLIQL